MKADVIRQVKDAEDRAVTKIQEAQAQVEKILHEARHQAVETRLEMLETARTNAKEAFETGAEALEPELEKVRQEFEAKMTNDTEQAQKVIDQVVDFVVTKFHERIGRDEEE